MIEASASLAAAGPVGHCGLLLVLQRGGGTGIPAGLVVALPAQVTRPSALEGPWGRLSRCLPDTRGM